MHASLAQLHVLPRPTSPRPTSPRGPNTRRDLAALESVRVQLGGGEAGAPRRGGRDQWPGPPWAALSA